MEFKKFTIIVNEMSIKNHNLPQGTFNLNPHIQRRIGKSDTIENAYIVEIKVELHDTPENRFPIDLVANIAGIFNIEGDNQEEIDMFLKTQGFQMVFPHLRSLVANATANAMIPAIVLPIVYANQFDD